MSARAAPARKTPARRAPARKAPGVGARIGAALAAGFRALPIPPGLLRRLRNWLLVLLLVAAVCAGLVAMGVPGMIGMSIAHAAGRMGLVVRTIQIEGREHVDRGDIYAVVMDAKGQDMPLVDLAGLREKLIHLPWVSDARVSRRLPDTLVVDIVERAPVAIWQYRQELKLVDKAGIPIATLDPRVIPDALPIVIGPGANAQVAALARLLDGQPVLKRLIQDATWVGDRRWDLRFQSGETLSLPEGDAEAVRALASFARADGKRQLLGKGIARFDMRDPGRIVVRVTRQPGFRLDKVDPLTIDAPATAPAISSPATEPATGTIGPQAISQERVL